MTSTMYEVTAADAFVGLIDELRDVQTVELFRLASPPSIEERPGSDDRVRAFASQARALRPEGGSFTETLLRIAEQHGGIDTALSAVAYHQSLDAAVARIEMSRQEVDQSSMRELLNETPAAQMLVVSSRVRTRAGHAHIPLLDYKLPATERNVAAAQAIAAHSGGGLLVMSGSSFHLYGDYLLDDSSFRRWLLHAQLLGRFVDSRWITHQLIEGRAAIRISRGAGKTRLPVVVSRVRSSVPR